MFFDKILNALKIENLFPSKQEIEQLNHTNNIKDIDNANKLISEVHKLSIIINNTTDENEFYSSYDKLISTLGELVKYEGIVNFSISPSQDLYRILSNKEKIVNSFVSRTSATIQKLSEPPLQPEPKPDSEKKSKSEPKHNQKNESEQKATSKSEHVLQSQPEVNISKEELPFISERVIIRGLHLFFINVMREILECGKIVPVSLMREYNLSKNDLMQILEEAKEAKLIDSDNQILVSQYYFEKFIDCYEPTLYNCDHCTFDKELLICIGEISIENGAETLYEEFDPDVILDYLKILESLGVLYYNTVTNKFDALMSIDKFCEKWKYIPDTSKSQSNYSTLEDLDQLEGHDFEYVCADILRKNGFIDVTVTRGSGDHGIDIFATKDEVSYAVQCKCYTSNIGNSAVQQAHTGKSIYNRDIAVVLTNQYFTEQAKEEASMLGVKLWDRNKLQELISNSQNQQC